MEQTAVASGTSQYLGFFLAGEEFGVGILRVREILEYGTVTRVPSTPDWIRGVINLRGTVVPVVDLAAKLGLPRGEVTRRTCIVIVETSLDGEAGVLGLQADAVSQVLELGPADVEPPPSLGSRVRVDFLEGMGKIGPRFVLLLDLDRVLTSDEGASVAESVRGAGLVEDGAPDTAGAREEARP